MLPHVSLAYHTKIALGPTSLGPVEVSIVMIEKAQCTGVIVTNAAMTSTCCWSVSPAPHDSALSSLCPWLEVMIVTGYIAVSD
jgi:hypothetical protein